METSSSGGKASVGPCSAGKRIFGRSLSGEWGLAGIRQHRPVSPDVQREGRHAPCKARGVSATENLEAAEAVMKMREIVGAAPTCFFACGLSEIPFHLCPMYAQEVDAEGCVWFFSGADSVHNALLEDDPRVELMFCNASKNEYLAVYGRAKAGIDRDKIDELWGPMVKAWFPGGKDDPNLTVIRVQPEKVHYWDARDNKLVAMAKVLVGSVTGRSLPAGVEGELDP
jgi:general stress protein 26